MAVVTISRQFGVRGWMLGEALASRLDYQLISRVVINVMAREAKVSVAWIEAVEKEAGGRLMRMASKLVSSSFMDRHLGESGQDFDESRYIVFLKELILRLASKDNVILLGRGAQFIIPDKPHNIKIFLAASMEDRKEFIAETWEVSLSDAEQMILNREKKWRHFLKGFDPRNPEDPCVYNLTLNMSHIDLEYAEEIIVGLIEHGENRKGDG